MKNLEANTMEKVNDNKRISQATFNHMIEPSSIKICGTAISSPIETIIRTNIKDDYVSSDSLELELYLFIDGYLLLNKINKVIEKEVRQVIIDEIASGSNSISVGQVVVTSESHENEIEACFSQLYFNDGA